MTVYEPTPEKEPESVATPDPKRRERRTRKPRRVNGNGDRMDSMVSGMPWWGKSIWVLGPVTFFCAALFAVHVGWAPSPVLSTQRDMLTALTALTTSINAHDVRLTAMETHAATDRLETVAAVTKNSSSILMLQKDINTGLRKICRNTAKNQDANVGCDAIQ